MDRITVDLNELLRVVTEMKQDGHTRAIIEIIENDDPHEDVPGFVSLSAPDPVHPGVEIEYDYIDAEC